MSKIGKILQKFLDWFEDENIVWRETRGNIVHEYTFHPVEGGVRAQFNCYGLPGTEPIKPKIQYHLQQYSKMNDDVERGIFFWLVEDTIHELSHWAHPWEPKPDHSRRWSETIYPELGYIHDVKFGYEK